MKTLWHFSGTADLYGSLDPFQRQPRSPKALALSSEVEIIKVDLSGYSQVKNSTLVWFVQKHFSQIGHWKATKYGAVHPVCRNVLLLLSLKVARACLGSR